MSSPQPPNHVDNSPHTTDPPQPEPLTVFIALRKDLQKDLGWPTGSIVTQACHASTAVIWRWREDPDVVEYLGDLERMHKVTYEVLRYTFIVARSHELNEVNAKLKNANHLEKVCSLFDAHGIVHHK
ncbi:uncharacterized protein SPPG_02947 [Spizellomyces punctatus DAOM BR117]|uniref:peptidyl-tRNA hydrolase n=1 Tax=Spizellomyces punctatus (strain DAOM BR117) TaxID=645134 RepID=A0A0L0HNF8_SPIPD|nr:uncharacterized protein SPPG_02947 [Spizellomyces punctatus DAOM BR117]KND02485.1 hypothetical protein SPPG_02947 [Spizellomyces punctatus DAOM BR117]|eukprot:XP_016610524.1 hypothetical protein SPPG_02947 [Spizellomyces punctatus DAOM BR117]